MDYPDYTTEHQKGKHLTYEDYVKIQVRLQAVSYTHLTLPTTYTV